MHIHTLVLGIAHICIILAILAQAFMLSILNFILKTHPPGPMLIATKSWPEATWPRVIELWEGANIPCFLVCTRAGGVRLCGLEIRCEVHQVVEHPL